MLLTFLLVLERHHKLDGVLQLCMPAAFFYFFVKFWIFHGRTTPTASSSCRACCDTVSDLLLPLVKRSPGLHNQTLDTVSTTAAAAAVCMQGTSAAAAAPNPWC